MVSPLSVGLESEDFLLIVDKVHLDGRLLWVQQISQQISLQKENVLLIQSYSL